MEQRRLWALVYIGCSFLLALFWKPDAWRYLRDDFIGKDTIFNLSRVEQSGLVVLTVLLIILLLWLNLYKSRLLDRFVSQLQSNSNLRHTVAFADLSLTILLFFVAIAIVPQFLYLYYMQIIAGLPMQWIASLPTFEKFQKLVLMNPVDSLNTMVSGLTFWSMIAGVLLYWVYRYTGVLDPVGRAIVGVVALGLFSSCLLALF